MLRSRKFFKATCLATGFLSLFCTNVMADYEFNYPCPSTKDCDACTIQSNFTWNKQVPATSSCFKSSVTRAKTCTTIPATVKTFGFSYAHGGSPSAIVYDKSTSTPKPICAYYISVTSSRTTNSSGILVLTNPGDSANTGANFNINNSGDATVSNANPNMTIFLESGHGGKGVANFSSSKTQDIKEVRKWCAASGAQCW